MKTIRSTHVDDQAAVPRWAVLQRELIAELERGIEEFAAKYTTADGRLIFHGTLGVPPDDRDGVDDFYESVFNWPQFYLMSGSRSALTLAERIWEGVTDQLTEMGMLRDEYERHYDWFHQGEGLLLLTFICLADPTNAEFEERARRFASLFVDPSYGNYDDAVRIIKAPHNGADGAAVGLTNGEPYFPWSPSLAPYGLPIDWIDGVESFEQALHHDDVGRRLGEEMWLRMGRGDTAVNLAASSLVLNAYIMSGEPDYYRWVQSYTGAWAERAHAVGLLPDNVGLSGEVGEYLGGRWYGGHYGWSWPHGIHSVGTAGIIAACNAAIEPGADGLFDVMRSTLDRVIEQGAMLDPESVDMSMRGRWEARFAREPHGTTSFLVPYRINDSGWHDFMPMQTALPAALWHFSGARADEDRLRTLQTRSRHDWSTYDEFRDKEDAGHEEPWLAFLWGENPTYPEQALTFARQECARRVAAIRTDDPHAVTKIHHWQGRNPVSTEALAHLTLGAPQTLYNGGLLQARVRYWDSDRRLPGLPDGVAALVSKIEWLDTRLTLVNTSAAARALFIQGGAFAEHQFASVTVADRPDAAAEPTRYFWVELAPMSTLDLRLELNPRFYPPTYHAPWFTAQEGSDGEG